MSLQVVTFAQPDILGSTRAWARLKSNRVTMFLTTLQLLVSLVVVTSTHAFPSLVVRSSSNQLIHTRPPNPIALNLTRREQKWRQRFEQLREYVKENGHCNPSPREDLRLAMWTKNQRMKYNHLKEDDTLCPQWQEKLDLLNSIGFVWSVHDENWMQMYGQLVEFYKANGHCNVPISQRQAVGDWTSPSPSTSISRNHDCGSTSRRFGGHSDKNLCDDLQRPHLWSHKLARWVAQQRLRYKRTVDENYITVAKSQPLNHQQVELLENIQFTWYPRDDLWWKRFEQLQDFKSVHGHCRVPQRFVENQELGLWCHHQRRACKEYVLSCMIEGNVEGVFVSGLNKERLQALRSIDFCWFPEEPFSPPPTNVLDSWYVTRL